MDIVYLNVEHLDSNIPSPLLCGVCIAQLNSSISLGLAACIQSYHNITVFWVL